MGKQREAPAARPTMLLHSQTISGEPPAETAADGMIIAAADARSSSQSLVMVTGLPADCTVLELKSRLEMYGPISRILIDADGLGYVTFRSDNSAESAIAAALDPAFGVAVRSKKVLIIRARDPPKEWNAGTRGYTSFHSKLLRAEIPLSRHGRSNKKLSSESTSTKSVSDPFEGREIIACDDLL